MNFERNLIMQSSIKLYIPPAVVPTLALALTVCGILLGYDNITNIAVFTLYALSIVYIVACSCGIYVVSSGHFKLRPTVTGSFQNQGGKKIVRYYIYLCYFSISALCASAGYFLLASTVLLSLIMIIFLKNLLLDKIKELDHLAKYMISHR